MRTKVLIVVVLIAVGLMVAYVRLSQSANKGTEGVTASAALPNAQTIAPNSTSDAKPIPVKEDSQAVLRESYALAFRDSKDLGQLARRLLTEAKSGSGEAQYYLFAILSECDAVDQAYLTVQQNDGRSRRRTLDEAMQYAADTKGFGWENLRDLYQRCHQIFDSRSDFGVAADWLRMATDGGQPLAQAYSAIVIASGGINNFESESAQIRRNEARTLAIEALSSKEPEAIEKVGTVAVLLAGPDKQAAARHMWVWLLAACQRGLDCSTRSNWYRFQCLKPNVCQPFDESGLDLVRRLVGAEFEELQSRATQLNERIDQGRFDELGF